MNSQTLLVVDDKDKVLGYASREECHTGRGRKHRAFMTLLFDKQNRVLLQRRRHKLFDDFWDFTAISHNLHMRSGDESYKEASDRALLKELGIKGVTVQKVGGFSYFAKDGKNCENEYCAILIGTYDGKIAPNKNEVYEAKRVGFGEFLVDIEKNPQKYTPWARLAAKKLKGAALPNLLRQELNKFSAEFGTYVKSYFEGRVRAVSSYGLLIKRMYKELDDFSAGGKKLRAFLVWLGYRIAGGSDLKKVLNVCLAQELIHSFLLIHDDIIDLSDRRRGKPTIHRRFEGDYGEHYGKSQAIVLGDIAAFEALKLVLLGGFDDKSKVNCARILTDVILETAYGEGLDVELSFKASNYQDVLKMTELKTARYSFVGPLMVGASLGRINSVQKKAIANFGTNVGLAFQIQDDILGVFGEEKETGKSVLSDMREGKNTVLIYKTRELVRGTQGAKLKRLWGRRSANLADLKAVKAVIGESGALLWCMSENQRLIRKAKKELGGITKDPEVAQMLSEIADFVINREK